MGRSSHRPIAMSGGMNAHHGTRPMTADVVTWVTKWGMFGETSPKHPPNIPLKHPHLATSRNDGESVVAGRPR